MSAYPHIKTRVFSEISPDPESLPLMSLGTNVLGVIVSHIKDPSYYSLVMATSRTWQQCVNPYVKGWLQEFIFGAKDWARFFGGVGKEPPLPSHIFNILMKPCLYWEGKKIEETHLLILIPKSVDGVSLTLNRIQELIQSPKGGGYATNYKRYSEYEKKDLGDLEIEDSYWVLLTEEVIPSSQQQPFEAQKALLKETDRVPTTFEATLAAVVQYVEVGEKLCAESSPTYTRCQEKVNNKEWRVLVGSFGAKGIVINSHYDHVCTGDFGLRALRAF